MSTQPSPPATQPVKSREDRAQNRGPETRLHGNLNPPPSHPTPHHHHFSRREEFSPALRGANFWIPSNSNAEEIRRWRALCCLLLLRFLDGRLAVFSLFRRIRKNLDNLPHRGAFHALFLYTQSGDVEDVHGLVQGSRGKPGIQNLRRSLLVGSRHLSDPLDDVDAFTELAHRLPSGHQLQKHHAETVHVALLVHPQRVCVFCGTNKKESIERTISGSPTVDGMPL
ncbi:hypothetical protein BHE74_00052046 [Ensete ventricosum]|nr:hypothetical protein BHE74_00052046 [Ensete ventricosum]